MRSAGYVFTCERDEYGWTTYITFRDPEENERFERMVNSLQTLIKDGWIYGD